ncbi:MAG: hypothetical protein HGB17_18465 [Syntrophobacteraceae bacterium]|nr:hypothetical protein [Syntrophobacteraceae bacterium]
MPERFSCAFQSWRLLKGNGHDDCCHLRCVDIVYHDWASDRLRHGVDGGDLFCRAGGDKRFVHAPGEDVLQHDRFHPPGHPFFHPDRQLDELRRHRFRQPHAVGGEEELVPARLHLSRPDRQIDILQDRGLLVAEGDVPDLDCLRDPGEGEGAGCIADLRDQGLVRGVGISVNRWEPANVIRALRTGLVDCVQVVYNIFDQNPEDELFGVCQEVKVGVIAVRELAGRQRREVG